MALYQNVDGKLIQKIASERGVELSLNSNWINKQTISAWKEYTQKKVYKDSSELPSELSQLFDTINEYLYNVTIIAK